MRKDEEAEHLRYYHNMEFCHLKSALDFLQIICLVSLFEVSSVRFRDCIFHSRCYQVVFGLSFAYMASFRRSSRRKRYEYEAYT